MSFACRVLGHRVGFWAEERTMRWRCVRDCGFEGEKEHPSAADASRYADAFDRDDRASFGRRAPISLLPLRLIRRGDRSER